MAACSVYTSELVETTTGITNGGSDSSGGKPSTAGTSNGTGGKVTVEPSGGQGGDEPVDTPNGGKSGEPAGGTSSGSGGTARRNASYRRSPSPVCQKTRASSMFARR